MIDFVKINYSDKNYQLPTDRTDFIINVNNETGETDGKRTGKYYGMEIIKYQSDRTIIKGSLHKFSNRTDFNGDDLDVLRLSNSISNLSDELNLNPENCLLENVEIGINVQLPFSPNKILQNLLFHRHTAFSNPIPNAYYYQCEKDDYFIKFYNKTAQYERKKKELQNQISTAINDKEKQRIRFNIQAIEQKSKPNTLRFEIKFVKMRTLKDLGMIKVSDLLNPDLFIKFKNLLLNEFQELYFYDYTTDETNMTKPETNNIKDYRNPNYWKNLNRFQRCRQKKRFDKITLNHSQNIKGLLIELFTNKIDILTKKSLDLLRQKSVTFSPIISDSNVQHFHHSDIGGICCTLPTDNSNVSERANNSYCEVTKLDISMQKKGSKFLCFSGLKFYKENNPATYQKLANRYLTEKMKTRPIEDQFYYIAHNIRNQKTNPPNNRQRFEQRNYPKHQLQINFIN